MSLQALETTPEKGKKATGTSNTRAYICGCHKSGPKWAADSDTKWGHKALTTHVKQRLIPYDMDPTQMHSCQLVMCS